MKLKISLAQYNDTGSSASVESDEGGTLHVAEGMTYPAKRCCLSAAKKLRTLARRFEALAEEEKPYHGETHDRINKLN